MREITVPLPGRDRSYRIVLGAGLRQQLGVYLAQVLPGRRLWVVSDTLVGRLYGQEMVARLNHRGFRPLCSPWPGESGANPGRWWPA